tara:strand:+ start:2755 stop:3036 length:282 start_codon:yes stop_codon:yes gene_type:complete
MKKISDQQRVKQAFVNSYNIIVSGKDLEEYLDELEVSLINLDIIFAHDPTTKLTKFELLFLLTYFEDEEDYERCAVLDKMLRDGIKNVPKTNK